jgi:2OG-Fe(II) oxygenase superfamily
MDRLVNFNLFTRLKVNTHTSIFLTMMAPPADSTGSMIPPSAKLFSEPHLLRQNLRDYGWSPVLVDVSVLSKMIEEDELMEEDDDSEDGDGAKKKPLILLQHHRDWAILHECMFDQTTFGPSVTYRRAESGSPGSLVEEPKQSLELKRAATRTTTTTATNDEQYEVQARMKSWITILHAVAWTVAKNLDWPDDTLIGKRDECGDYVDNSPPPMDLLRAFLYDGVPSTTIPPSDEDVSLGSSPHTDWGSLTVVWQDRVGGLETYCRHNNCWVPVPAALVPDDDDNNNFFPLIIHIGDITSLALGGSSCDTDGNSVWPSPLHRVRSPETGRRRSLVYFCYPTPKAGSLQNLQHLLQSEDFSADHQHDQVRLEHYSLLQNQSLLLLGGKPSDARKVYERILHQPLVEVFMEKWSQVQR